MVFVKTFANQWKTTKLGSKATVSKTYLILKLLLIWSNIHLAPVARKADNAILWINHYPVDSAIGFRNVYPLDSDLSGG